MIKTICTDQKMALVKELCRAVLTSNIPSLQKLISEGGDVNTNHASETACTRAITLGVQKVIDIILYSNDCNINAGNGDDRTPLYIAVKCGRINVVKQLVALGADLNKPDCRNTTPLMVAIKEGHNDIAKYLIENAVDLENENYTGETALHMACERVNGKIVQLLLWHNVFVDKQTNDLHITSGYTPLMLSVASILKVKLKNKNKSEALHIVQMLIKQECDLDKADNHGNTALHIASDYCDVHTVCVLAENGANLRAKNVFGQTAFDIALKKKRNGLSTAICLLLYGFFIDEEEDAQTIFNTVLSIFLADGLSKENVKIYMDNVLNRYTLLFELLLKDISHLLESFDLNLKVDENNLHLLQFIVFPNSRPQSLAQHCRRTIRRAIKTKLLKGITSLPIAKCLKLYLALDYNYFNNDPKCLCDLILSIQEGDLKSAELFLKSGLNLDENIMECTPLTCAAALGNADMVNLLLNYDANVMVLDNNGNSAIHEAAVAGHIDILETLIEHNCNIDLMNADRESPVLRAAINGNFLAVQYLVERGAECKLCNKKGRYLIHYAAASGLVSASKALFENGVSVNQRDVEGNTPLHLAASRGFLYTANDIDLPALFPVEATVHSESSRNRFHKRKSKHTSKESGKEKTLLISHKEVLFLLLSLNADITAVNHAGKTAIDVALQFDHADIAAILDAD